MRLTAQPQYGVGMLICSGQASGGGEFTADEHLGDASREDGRPAPAIGLCDGDFVGSSRELSW